MTSTPAIDRFVAKSKLEIRLANEKGLQRLPSVDGPYLFNPTTGMVVGLQGSKEYRHALGLELDGTPPGKLKATVHGTVYSLNGPEKGIDHVSSRLAD